MPDSTPLMPQSTPEPTPHDLPAPMASDASAEPIASEPADEGYREVARATPGGHRRRSAPWLLGLILLVVTAVAAMQIVTLQSLRSAEDEVAALRTALDEVSGEVSALKDQVVALGGAVADPGVPAGGDATSTPAPDASPAGGTPAGDGTSGLPPYPSSGADVAVTTGMTLPPVTGTEYYSGETTTLDSEDDVATLWLVWAHWCPHCQADLPQLATVWGDQAEDFPDVRVVTVSTSIDPTRGNPLEPYLDESDFPFPVVVDTDGSIAATFGTTAFPFWVVTDPEGTVLLRRPGALGPDQITALLAQLQHFVASTGS